MLVEGPLLVSLARNSNLRVVVIDNLGEQKLQAHCEALSIDYLKNEKSHGFSSNNNKAFLRFLNIFDLSDSDYFVCCNPDVEISDGFLSEFVLQVSSRLPDIVSINLFRDRSFTKPDASIRHFPRLSDYFFALLGGVNPACIDRSAVRRVEHFDWAAGSFLAFTVRLFRQLDGFDERYFMYFEDVDICLRAWRERNVKVCYFPQVKAFHPGGFRNRSIFSRHFCWYLKSFFRFYRRYYFGGQRPVRGKPSVGA
ncbi:glycosyltransferase [Pseudomonas sp. MAHUQ-62]|uniref:glycosyltransferase n=1 Tax=Pseudomonas sp. GCM10023245 TaxID=3252652 RepID=UPI00360643C4